MCVTWLCLGYIYVFQSPFPLPVSYCCSYTLVFIKLFTSQPRPFTSFFSLLDAPSHPIGKRGGMSEQLTGAQLLAGLKPQQSSVIKHITHTAADAAAKKGITEVYHKLTGSWVFAVELWETQLSKSSVPAQRSSAVWKLPHRQKLLCVTANSFKCYILATLNSIL